MRILHLTGKDFFGAGRAAYRLHKGLQVQGIESFMWVGAKKTEDASVINIHKGKLKQWQKRIKVFLEKKWIAARGGHFTGMFSTGEFAFNIAKEINREKPDVVHIHWINRAFLNLSNLKDIKAPIVVSMHDKWYFTGGCHYTRECMNYLTNCGTCVFLNSGQTPDLSSELQSRKQKEYAQISNLTFIGLSAWMAQSAKESFLLKEANVCQLPNGIDTSKFKSSKENDIDLGLDKNKKTILFAAVDALSDDNKGFYLLEKAIALLEPEEYQLLIIGGEGNEDFSDRNFTVHNVGYVASDERLIKYLSAVDVVVVPSKQENLSNMIMEALACATPVVAFNIGGNGDMIEHKKNGYLAIEKDAKDLAKGIEWCTEDMERHCQLSQNAREKVIQNFEVNKVAQQYIELYKKVIERNDQSN